MKKLFLIFVLLMLIPFGGWAAQRPDGQNTQYGCTALNTGVLGSLNFIKQTGDGNTVRTDGTPNQYDLKDGDSAIVTLSTGIYKYIYIAAFTQATSSPTYIRPIDYSTSGVWLRVPDPPHDWPSKTTPVDGDSFVIGDSEASNAAKSISIANLWANNFAAKVNAIVSGLSLGTASTRNAEDSLTNGSNLPDGAAIIAYGNANWGGGTDTIGWDFTALSSAPGSPVAGKVYRANGAASGGWDPLTYNPAGDEDRDYFVLYTGSGYVGVVDLAGNLLIDSIPTSALDVAANVKSVLDAADYAAIRTLLGLVIGTNVQAYDADLTTYAGITPAANVQSILQAANYAAIRTLLGLVVGTNVQAYDADLTIWAGVTPSANGRSLVAMANYATMFGSLKQAATDSATGVVELATTTEAAAGSDTGRAVTPAGLAANDLPTVISGDPDTLDDTLATNPRLYRGGYIRYNAAGEATLDAFTAAGQSVSIEFYPSVAIIVNPNASQTIIRNGVALAAGEALINSSEFGLCSLTYLGSNSIDAVCSSTITEETP